MRDDAEREVEPLVVQRPEPSAAWPDRARAWLEWFGVTRLVTSAIATVVVCLGAFWLLRTPPPPTEAALPTASTGSTPAVTLAPPGTEVHGQSTANSSDAVIVHVAGAVNAAGVYSLPAGSRVDDAVAAAGGSTSAADPDALNLAATLTDGSRVYVPLVGEVVAVEAIDTTAPATGPLDVNRASASELDTLPGIGPATATAIVTERDRNGPFASVADLERVPGIGPAKLAALSDLVST